MCMFTFLYIGLCRLGKILGSFSPACRTSVMGVPCATPGSDEVVEVRQYLVIQVYLVSIFVGSVAYYKSIITFTIGKFGINVTQRNFDMM